MSKKQDQLVLVGFGKYALADMLDWRGTDKEDNLLFAPDKWPPRFRVETACSQKDIETFLEYVKWATGLLNELKENNG